MSRAASSTRPSSTKHGQPTGPIQNPIHLKAHLFLFFVRRSPYFLKRGPSQKNPPSSSLPLILQLALPLPYRPNSSRSPSSSLVQKTPAHLLPHSYRKRMLLFFHTYRKPQPSFFPGPLALPLGSSLATLLKPMRSARRPQGKWSRLAPAPRR